MPLIKLFGNRFSGHSYKVALCLALTDTPYEYEEISLSVPRPQRPDYFRKNSRYNEVPLVLIDGEPFVQSNAILLHLSQNLGLMSDRKKLKQIYEWLMWEQSRLGSSLPNLRVELKFKDTHEPATAAWLRARLEDDLSVLSQQLNTSEGFVLGDAPTIVDCSMAGYLYWLKDAELDINDWPIIAAWLTRIQHLKGWQHPDELLAG